jgi:hypothetical protein
MVWYFLLFSPALPSTPSSFGPSRTESLNYYDKDPYTPSFTLSSNVRQLAYTAFDVPKICMCDIPCDILATIWPEQAKPTTYPSRLLWSDITPGPAAVRHNLAMSLSLTPPAVKAFTSLPTAARFRPPPAQTSLTFSQESSCSCSGRHAS